MIYTLDGVAPRTRDTLFVAPSATVIGDVQLGPDTSVWFSAVIRGDIESIVVGEGTNVQDNAVLHVDRDFPLSVGCFVTVGHQAILHGCTVADKVLVGMGARVLNGAQIGECSIVAAGALVPPGKTYPPRSLILGSPAKVVRELSREDIDGVVENARRYIANAKRFAAGME